MTVTVEATYENGTLKLDQPLPRKEREKVRVTVDMGAGSVRATQGLIGWNGTPEALERIALDPLEDL